MPFLIRQCQIVADINYTIDVIKQFAHVEIIYLVIYRSNLIQKWHYNGDKCHVFEDLPTSVLI